MVPSTEQIETDRGPAMKSEKVTESNQSQLRQTQQNTSSGSEMLTNSEIKSLQQNKKELNAYRPKAFAHLYE